MCGLNMAKSNIVVSYSVKDLVKKIAKLNDLSAKKFVKHLESLNESNPQFKKLRKNTQEYWQNNVYKVFNARKSTFGLPVSGQLGKSLKASKNKNEIIFKMKRLTHGKEGGISGGEDWDYGRYLRNDKPSMARIKHAQDTETENKGIWLYPYNGIDAKVKSNKEQQPVSPLYWKEWRRKYKNNMTREYKKFVRSVYKEYVNEVMK